MGATTTKTHASHDKVDRAAPARHAPAAVRSPEPIAGNQEVLHALAARETLTVSDPSDAEEHEADRLADAFVSGASPPATRATARQNVIHRACASCQDEQATVYRKAAGTASPRVLHLPSLRVAAGRGAALPREVRAPYEQFFRADFSHVRVHDGAPADRAASVLNAHAFAHGADIYFARGRFDPHTTTGRRLLAHELAHTTRPAAARIRRQQAGAANPALPPGSEAGIAANNVADAVKKGDVSAAVVPLRQRSVDELKAIRTTVKQQAGVDLEHWLTQRMNRAQNVQTAANVASIALSITNPGVAVARVLLGPPKVGQATAARAEEGLRLLWPALDLIEQLLVFDEGFREIEQAQIDVIKTASAESRKASRDDPRMENVLKLMDAKEEYDARVLLNSTPEGLLSAANHAIARGEKDPVFDAVLALAPAAREQFVRDHELDLYHMLSLGELELVRSMARQITIHGHTFGGNEVDALIARLRLATEGRRDDMVAVQSVIDRAVALLRERRTLTAELASKELPADERATKQKRLDELAGLDRLFSLPKEAGGRFAEKSFMRLIAEARDNPDAFGADAQRFAEFAPTPQAARDFALQVAKQRILDAGSDLEGIRTVLYSTHAPPVTPAEGASPSATAAAQQAADVALRKDLLRDPDVAKVVSGLKGSEQDMVAGAKEGDAFDSLMYEMSQATRGARWGELFKLTLRIARNEDYRTRYDARRGELWGVHANIHGDQRTIVEDILRDKRLPLAKILKFTSDVDLIRTAFAEMPEDQRVRLRTGWALSRHLVQGEPTDDQKAALQEYNDFEAEVRKSQTTAKLVFDDAGFEAVLGAALGSQPSLKEMSKPEGRYMAAALMYERQQRREALGRGASAHFTETDETMVAAARQFASLWLTLRDRTPHGITMVELATLSALHQQFEHRAEEFAEASNAVGEMAGMIAATVAGIVVVVATGGAATPGVIAIAAASGAGARVVTREMFGEDYYNALSDQAARDALLGAIDGALAVVSGSLAAKGAELVGLGGHALTSSASRAAGVVAEEATQPFARRVAASAVESALDGLFSGATSEAFGAMTDDATWRRGVMNGLVKVGQAALVGGLVGLAAGGVVGAAMPVVGRGARRLWEGIVGQSIDTAATRAGVQDTLTAARQAAREGRVADANRLAREVEEHLAPEQVLALRDEINTQLRQKLGRPPGTAEPKTPRQAELLRESGTKDARLGREHMDAEWDIVKRSEPQPSTTEGYVDEVDLGNGHSWKRQVDGSWCRFSPPPNLCAIIPGAPRMNASASAKAEAAFAQLTGLRGEIAGARELMEDWPGVADKLIREHTPGQRGLRLDKLTEHERLVLADVFPDKDLESLTLADLRAARGRPGAEYTKLVNLESAAIERLKESTRPLYDKVRAASPRETVRRDVIKRASGLDQVSGRPPLTGKLQADHVVPVREIVDMPGFSRLDWEDQMAIADWRNNLRAVDARVNASRGDTSWSEAFPQRGTYTPDALQRIADYEEQMRQELQQEIDRRLRAAGRRVGP